MPRLIDTHAHTQFAAYSSDYKEVIKRALDDNIWLVNIGTQRDTSAKAVKIAEEYPEGVYAIIGLHPIHTDKSFHDTKEFGDLPAQAGNESAKEFISRGEEFDYDYYFKLGSNPKVVGIGECGLDYYHLDDKTEIKQEKAFVSQIELSKKLGKPLMVHCRSALPSLIKILNRESSKLLNPCPGIIHFFSGSVEEAAALKEMGFYFSFGGVTTFVRDYDPVIKLIGLEKILLETDAPYVTPIPYRGKRNEPSYIKYISKAIADVLEINEAIVAEKTTTNALEVLNLKVNNV